MTIVKNEDLSLATWTVLVALIDKLVEGKALAPEQVGEIMLAAGKSLQEGGNEDAQQALLKLTRKEKDRELGR